MAQAPAPGQQGNTLEKVADMFSTEGAITSREQLDEILKNTILPPNPRMKTGKLANGLTYTILPNAVPGGRFEAHLQIMAGSADESEAQQAPPDASELGALRRLRNGRVY